MRNYILIAVASAIVGAAAGVLVTKIVDGRKHKKDLEAVNDTMTAVKEKRAKKVKVLDTPDSEEGVGSGAQEELETTVSEEEEETEAVAEEKEYRDTLGPYRPSEDHPYLITEAEFEANDGRDKRSVFYYEGDERAYFGDDGTELDTEEDLGKSEGNLDEDRFLDSPDGVVYIRNNRKSEDYAVDMYPGASEVLE